jgi:hypothetical protein
MTDLVLHGKSLDQAHPLDRADIVDAFAEVDNILEEIRSSKNPEIGFDKGREYKANIQVKGLALAKLLYGMHQDWSKYGLEEAFAPRVEFEWGFHRGTVNQYVNVWKSVFDNDEIPETVKEKLLERPMQTLKRLPRPVNENKLDDDDWDELSDLPDDKSVKNFIDDKMGKSPKGRPALTISMYPDGTLYAFEGDRKVTLGVLRNTTEDLKDRTRWKAIERIKKSSGIIDMG